MVSSVMGISPSVAVTPPEAIQSFADLIHADCESTAGVDAHLSPNSQMQILPVAGRDIGACLNQVLTHLLAVGHSLAMALNSDGPTLPSTYIKQAVADLETADIVLGPSEDGGYYLIGLKRPEPRLFEDIDWSTNQVTYQTVCRAQTLHLSVALLPTWYDVDTAADLDRLCAELAVLPGEALPFTRRFFALQFPRSPA